MKKDYSLLKVFVTYAALLLILVIAASSCAVKTVLASEDKINQVWEKAALAGKCKADSFVTYLPGKTDTVKETKYVSVKINPAEMAKAIKQAVDSTDIECTKGLEMSYTAGYNDGVDEARKSFVSTTRVDTLKTRKYDLSREHLLEEIIKQCQGKLIASEAARAYSDSLHNEEVKSLNKKIKQATRDKRMANLRFWILVIAIFVYLFRKYLYTFATAGFGWIVKVFSIFKKFI